MENQFLATAADAPRFMSVHDQAPYLLNPSGGVINYMDEKGLRQGVWDIEYKESPEDDDDVLVREVCNYVDGKRHGRCEFWRADAMEIVYFENGVPHGTYFDYDDEGTLRVIGVYERGMKSGIWHHYNWAGELKEDDVVDYTDFEGVIAEFISCSDDVVGDYNVICFSK